MKQFLFFPALFISPTASAISGPMTPLQQQVAPQTQPIDMKKDQSDLELEARIHQELRNNVSTFNSNHFSITSRGGQVNIQGVAASQSEADDILSNVQSVSGVSGVNNGILIQSQTR